MIEDVERVSLLFLGFWTHFKVKPLDVALGIRIVLQNKIVFILVYFDRSG